MGTLLNGATQRRVYLRTEHIFGRSRLAHTFVGERSASMLHATIRWLGNRWELRDHSRNGMVVDNRPTAPNKPIILKLGTVIDFCGSGLLSWIVDDLAAPGSVLWPLGHDGPVLNLQSFNALPSEEERDVLIYTAPDGGWICQRGAQSQILRDGDEIVSAGRRWCFLSGAAAEDTLELSRAMVINAANTILHFDVSLDEEHVSLQILSDALAFTLGERSHHYCLLTLARKRIDDAKRGYDENAQGWIGVEILSKMLGVDGSHINIQIFRARKQFAQALPVLTPAFDVVERRRGEVRFGNWAVRITRGGKQEDLYRPQSTAGLTSDATMRRGASDER